MSKKQLSNLGYLMELLSVTAKDLSKAINIDQTSISRWRTGIRKPSVNMPYFDAIVAYFVQKNADIGGGLLEDFFSGFYSNKKRYSKDDLRKQIRNYILNVPGEKPVTTDTEIIQNNPTSCMYVEKHTGAEGRIYMVTSLLEAAEKLSVPTTIKIFEADHLIWISCNMQYCVVFFHKLKTILRLGHKVELIFQTKEFGLKNLEVNQMFLELGFHENMTMYTFIPMTTSDCIKSSYILSQRMAVISYCFDDDLNDMMNCTFRDKQYVDTQERLWEKCKLASSQILIKTKQSEYEDIIADIGASIHRSGSYFHMEKSLSFFTMSEELLNEILDANHLTKAQRKLCNEFYHVFREDIDAGKPHPMSGLYYILDEITAPLCYPTITNYTLSALSGKVVQMTREQYMRHFGDTAELLLKNDRYHVILHNTFISTLLDVSRPQSIWYKNDHWALIANNNDCSGKVKLMYGVNVKCNSIFYTLFSEIYNKIPGYKKNSAYTAELFTKIANGQGK